VTKSSFFIRKLYSANTSKQTGAFVPWDKKGSLLGEVEK
jgi:hypothetical protein